MYNEVVSNVTKYDRSEITRKEWHAVHQTVLRMKQKEINTFALRNEI